MNTQENMCNLGKVMFLYGYIHLLTFSLVFILGRHDLFARYSKPVMFRMRAIQQRMRGTA